MISCIPDHPIPQERVVILSKVENFTLIVRDGGPGYKLATHISCPSARNTSLKHERYADGLTPEEIFPDLDSWHAIVRQYTRSPVEDATLDTRPFPTFECTLTFRSSDMSVINLGFEFLMDPNKYCPYPSRVKATRTIRDHPQLANIKRFSICQNFFFDSIKVQDVANEVGLLFRYFNALDALTIYCCDLRPYFHSFLDFTVGIREPARFPSIKTLTIVRPFGLSDEQFTSAIVGLAKMQYASETPLERVVIQRGRMPVGMEEGLRPWVGSVEHCCAESAGTGGD